MDSPSLAVLFKWTKGSVYFDDLTGLNMVRITVRYVVVPAEYAAHKLPNQTSGYKDTSAFYAADPEGESGSFKAYPYRSVYVLIPLEQQ